MIGFIKKNVVRLEIQAGREEGGQDGRHDRNEILRDIYQQRAQGGTKKAVKELVARHRFKKGVTVADIEKRALFVTR